MVGAGEHKGPRSSPTGEKAEASCLCGAVTPGAQRAHYSFGYASEQVYIDATKLPALEPILTALWQTRGSHMRGLIVVSLVALMLACVPSTLAGGDPLQGLASGRTFFPKDWVSGFVDFAVAPPHNEPDLNRCTSSTGTDGGPLAPCSAFARYVGSGYMEFRPVGTGMLRRLFVFFEPRAFMGRNLPQVEYTNSMSPIAIEHAEGVGVSVTRNLELRVTTHRVDWLGKYQNDLGSADLGKNGPLSVYTTISARWYFGGYGHRVSGY
jgi:hypothetical protein